MATEAVFSEATMCAHCTGSWESHLQLHPQLQYLSITLQHFHWYVELHKPGEKHQHTNFSSIFELGHLQIAIARYGLVAT